MMELDFNNNYFQLFEMPVSMDIDEQALDERFKLLQRELHPDRFINADDAQKRWSLQATSLVNQARLTLVDDLKRASYLLSLQGIDLNAETDTKMSGEFLMMQMDLREALSDIRSNSDPFAALDVFVKTIRQHTSVVKSAFEQAYQQEDYSLCRDKAREWQFFSKLRSEARELESRLEDELF